MDEERIHLCFVVRERKISKMLTLTACKKNERIFYLDILRVLATFAVIAIHVSAQNWYSTDIYSYEWNMFNLFDGLDRWAVPVFVMISGVLFLDHTKSLNLKKLYTQNILRLVSAFVFWSFVYAVYHGGSIDVIIRNFLSGPYHMWFLPMMVGLYIIIPILRKITENESVMQYFLLLALIFTFIIPMMLQIPYLSYLQKLYGNVNFHITLGYSCYFICGYYLDKKEIVKAKRIWIYCLGIIGFLLTVLISIWSSRIKGEPYGAFFDNFSINVMLESIAVFVFIKSRWSKKTYISNKFRNIICALAQYSFGIYLVHVLVIEILQNVVGLDTLSFNAGLSVPIITIIVFSISLAISATFYHIPFLRKYVV